MADVKVSLEGIIPLGEFKARATSLLERLNETGDPIVVTQNGKPAAVVLSPDAYEAMRDRQRFLESVAAGIEDVEAGRVVDDRKVRSWLKSWGTAKERPVPK